jgi:hypothetical protein
VVGPDTATEAEADRAVAELAGLVSAGGALAAAAGVELTAGFRSARLHGARGDRRDAVLAALRVLGMAGAARLGDRAGPLVALFGPAATKPVGAAAAAAIAHGQWAAVHLASAASDLLGPEQLVRVLALRAPVGVEPIPHGAASTLAGQLARVLADVPRPRRLALLVDLWERVVAEQTGQLRRKRLLDSQCKQDRIGQLRQRYLHFNQDLVLDHVRRSCGPNASTVEVALWIPSSWFWSQCLNRVLYDAIAATALVRAAIAVCDHGMVDGLARCREELATAAELHHGEDLAGAARHVPGELGVPARPGCYVRELASGEHPAGYVVQRLAYARDYAIVVLGAVSDLVHKVSEVIEHGMSGITGWPDSDQLRDWRTVVGYSPVRPPAGWEQPPAFAPTGVAGPAHLADRLRSDPDAQPVQVERAADLLWYADLADALAQLHGHEASTVEYGGRLPTLEYNPPRPEPVPLRPALDSIPQAVAGAAQLVSLGGQAPARCRTWAELVDGLLAAAAIVEAMTGGFRLPAPLAQRDGSLVAGTGARVVFARDVRTLADWSNYMGNCLGGEYYLEEATTGKCVIGALRDGDGRILANVELRGSHRWHVAEIRARFNSDPDPELEKRFAAWVSTVPPERRPAPVPARRTHSRRGSGGHPAYRILRGVGDSLTGLAERQLAEPDTHQATEVLAYLAGGSHDPLTALRRAGPSHLARSCRDLLADPAGPGLPGLWAATGVRPMARALADLDPELRARFVHLDRLVRDAPLLGSLRRLARRPAVSSARTMDLVTARIRAAIGILAREGDENLAGPVAQQPSTGMLCALVIAVTSDPGTVPVMPVTEPGALSVPGFPASNLSDVDGPWQRAWPEAHELGADVERFRATVDERGLLVPSGWLGNLGWTALWRRAAR